MSIHWFRVGHGSIKFTDLSLMILELREVFFWNTARSKGVVASSPSAHHNGYYGIVSVSRLPSRCRIRSLLVINSIFLVYQNKSCDLLGCLSLGRYSLCLRALGGNHTEAGIPVLWKSELRSSDMIAYVHFVISSGQPGQLTWGSLGNLAADTTYRIES